MPFDHVMLDLETLGTSAGCSILSIGAVAFSVGLHESSWRKFYVGPISRESCLGIGLVEIPSTIQWWVEQENEARLVFDLASRPDCIDIKVALRTFTGFYPEDAKIWGNGADFDLPILGTAYSKANLPQPWVFRNSRCYRTMKSIFREIEKPEFIGIKHNALDDAMSQARHLVKILEELG